MNTTHEKVIELDGLRKSYGSHVAVEDVSFSVRRGSVVGLLGPNGAGKTTTMRMLLGLAKPDQGTARIHGQSYAQLANPARSVGAALDDNGIHPGRTARQHLAIAASMAGIPRTRVQQVLDETGLMSAADRRVGGFSLGMGRRLGLATALLGEPSVLVLDEPANGLDPEGIRWLRDRLRAFADAGGAVLVSSHVLAEVAQTADDIVVIAQGRVTASGSLAQLTAGHAGNLEDFYLGLTAETAGVR